MNSPPDQALLNLDKSRGDTSAHAVGRVRHLLAAEFGLPHRRMKVGHAGTLDPLATGVLVLMVGRATKLSDRLMDSGKTYLADVRLGATTPTDDLESDPVPYPDAAVPPTAEAVAAAVGGFQGEIQQVPPIHSAIKVGGRRAFDLARAGQDVKLEPRTVRLDRLAVVGYAYPDLRIEIDTGRGFYVRSLARDLGEALGVGGYLTGLRRTRVGPFAADAGVTLEQIEADGVTTHLQPVDVLDGGGR